MNDRKAILVVCCLVGAALLFAIPAEAVERGNWMVRARAVHFNTSHSTSYWDGWAGAGVSLEPRVTWEVDLSYYVTPHFSLELSFTDTKFQMEGRDLLSGSGDVAETRLMPVTLTGKWHFRPATNVSPYIGMGVNYTHFHGETVKTPLVEPYGAQTELSLHHSWGWAGQAGLDVYFTPRWNFNVDIKYVQIDSSADLYVPGSTTLQTDLSVDPWMSGLGFGFRF
jgi:outer membrane protein